MRPITKSSSILAAVRERIESGHNGFICHALADLRLQKRIKEVDRDRLRDHVRNMIHPYYAYGDWVEKNFPRTVQDSWARGTYFSDARAGRLAWLDHMIAEFKAKGD